MNKQDRFDRNFNRMTGGFIVVWVIALLASLALLGVGAWAVIQLVGWVISQ